MFVIGHRGTAGLELENTATSINRALNLGVDAVEFDVRKTKDNQLVLAHDNNLSRIANDSRQIKSLTVRELKKIRLNDGSLILTLEEAMAMINNRAYTIVDVKDLGCALLITNFLKQHQHQNISIASFKLQELAALNELNPSLHLIGLEHTKPFEIIQFAKRLNLDGIGINFWLLNPLTYWLAKRYHLDLYVYTLKKRRLAKLVGWLYPKAAICTDHPEWFNYKTRKKSRWPKSWQT